MSAQVVHALALEPGPESVPTARRFARRVLSEQPAELSIDAELVLSELATNAALHGTAPVVCRVICHDSGVRVEVEDAGRTLPIRVTQREGAMTGRGLALVESLAAAWGVEPLPGKGKVVWAELAQAGSGGEDPSSARKQMSPEELLAAWDDDEDIDKIAIELGLVPTAFLLDAKSNIDNVVRELSLMRAGEASGSPLPQAASTLVETVTTVFADVRNQIKRQASEASQHGRPITDLKLLVEPSADAAAETYLEALEETDRWARSAHLLTLAPPRSHRVLRWWYLGAIIADLKCRREGAAPPSVEPLASALAREVDRLDTVEDTAGRYELLYQLGLALARATTAEEMAKLTVRVVAEHLAVGTARVYLVTSDSKLRSVAWADPAGADDYQELDLDSDLPGPLVVRTGEPMFFRSLREIYGRFPDLRGHYPSERSLHVMPVTNTPGQPGALGVLALTFLGGTLEEASQIAFVEAVAELFATSLQKLTQS